MQTEKGSVACDRCDHGHIFVIMKYFTIVSSLEEMDFPNDAYNQQKKTIKNYKLKFINYKTINIDDKIINCFFR